MTLNSSQEWLEANLNHEFSIACLEPDMQFETIYGMFDKAYLSYRVIYKDGSTQLADIRRRYSEFYSLREDLVEKYFPYGILIPPLPPKATMSNFEEEFVRERNLGLNLFCESVVNSPWLRNDILWKKFILGNVADSSSNQRNPSDVELIGCLNNLHVPLDSNIMLKFMKDIACEVDWIDFQVKDVLSTMRQLQATEKKMISYQEELKVSIENWHKCELNRIHIFNGKGVNEQLSPIIQRHESAMHSIEQLNTVYRGKAAIEVDKASTLGVTLIALLEHEMRVCGAFKELFAFYEGMIQSIAAVHLKMENMKKNKIISPEKIPELLTLFAAQLKEKEVCIMTFHKGMYYFTVPTITRMRAYYYRKLTANYVTSQEMLTNSVLEVYKQFYEANFLRKEYCHVETVQMCNELDIKLIHPLPAASNNFSNTTTTSGKGIIPTDKQEGQQYIVDSCYGMQGLLARAMMFSEDHEANNIAELERRVRIQEEEEAAAEAKAEEEVRLKAQAEADAISLKIEPQKGLEEVYTETE